MNKKMIAKELLMAAKEIMAAGTFKCPDCGSKVLDQTKYCVKCKKKVKKAAADFPYATLIFKKNRVEFRVLMEEGERPRTGSNPYGRNAAKAIMTTIDIITKVGVPEENIEVIA